MAATAKQAGLGVSSGPANLVIVKPAGQWSESLLEVFCPRIEAKVPGLVGPASLLRVFAKYLNVKKKDKQRNRVKEDFNIVVF
ncbi:hypothetical protein [Mucilaginibacter rubeus]|uniref:hypothetical protein n=1 Tax=Mucilaginibacter rubeus TaxID=2027860 RepID=UPI003394C52A